MSDNQNLNDFVDDYLKSCSVLYDYLNDVEKHLYALLESTEGSMKNNLENSFFPLKENLKSVLSQMENLKHFKK